MSSLLSHPISSPAVCRIPLFTASAWPSSGSERYQSRSASKHGRLQVTRRGKLEIERIDFEPCDQREHLFFGRRALRGRGAKSPSEKSRIGFPRSLGAAPQTAAPSSLRLASLTRFAPQLMAQTDFSDGLLAAVVPLGANVVGFESGIEASGGVSMSSPGRVQQHPTGAP